MTSALKSGLRTSAAASCHCPAAVTEEPEHNPFNGQIASVKGTLQGQLFEVLNENHLDALAFPTLCYPPRRNGDLLGPADLNNGLAACAGFPALSVRRAAFPLGCNCSAGRGANNGCLRLQACSKRQRGIAEHPSFSVATPRPARCS
jgi:hypothetical protein